MTTTPTSIRFTDDELALIAVHQRRLQDKTGRPHTTTDVFRFLLRASKPKSDGQGELEREFRKVYANVFGDNP